MECVPAAKFLLQSLVYLPPSGLAHVSHLLLYSYSKFDPFYKLPYLLRTANFLCSNKYRYHKTLLCSLQVNYEKC
uniref:Putative secreted protein n=1 Tax=Ixodes ricinus TaxID=34613 RepID=A0A6B0TVB9_IXORI